MRSILIIVLFLLQFGFSNPAGTENSEQLPSKIIHHLESAYLYDRITIRSITLPDHAALSEFYAQQRFKPLWITTRGETKRARRLRQAISEAQAHGLDPRRYPFQQIDEALADGAPADAELLLSQAFLWHSRDRAQGGIADPARIDPDWYFRSDPPDALSLLTDIARGRDVIRSLNALWPESPEYWRLIEARAALLAARDRAPQVRIPGGKTLYPETSDDRVPLLRRRLGLTDPGDLIYDQQLAAAVAAFQKGAGLEPDGVLGPATLAVLNRTSEEEILQIDANLERWRWLPREFPDHYIWVNAADYLLTAVRSKRIELSMRVIVGRPYRQTPVFTESMKYLVINPYWDVPRNLAIRDQLPLLRTDAKAMAEKGFEAAHLDDGTMHNADSIDWTQVSEDSFPYRLRQKPGPANPLGFIKFMLPNQHAIYLHDTPSRALFERTERTFSSGCIRIDDAVALAEWVLAENRDPWNRARIENAITSGETRTIVLEVPTPVYIVYFTAYTNESGNLILNRDIYDRDARITAALRSPSD